MGKIPPLLILFLLFGLIASSTLVMRTTIFSGRASYKNINPITLENSYLFASPLNAKADGREKIRITVYLLDSRGLGVANQNVDLLSPNPLKVTAVQTITDDTGKAVFDLTSDKVVTHQISAKTQDGKTIPQKVRVVFY